MRAFLKTIFLLILAYLVLVHYTGFSKDIASAAGGTGEVIKDLQGNG